MHLVFDTETTGFPRDQLASTDKAQPHLVQLAMLLCEPSGLIRQQALLLVEAENWEIEHGAAEKHGYTVERTRRFGIPEKSAVQLFWRFLQRADEVIAHNVEFDLKIMRFAFYRYGSLDAVQKLNTRLRYCTMRSSTQLCAIPSARGQKWPTLKEAYSILLGKTLIGAHDALVDTRACWELWCYLTQRRVGDTPLQPLAEADHNAGSLPDPALVSSDPASALQTTGSAQPE